MLQSGERCSRNEGDSLVPHEDGPRGGLVEPIDLWANRARSFHQDSKLTTHRTDLHESGCLLLGRSWLPSPHVKRRCSADHSLSPSPSPSIHSEDGRGRGSPFWAGCRVHGARAAPFAKAWPTSRWTNLVGLLFSHISSH